MTGTIFYIKSFHVPLTSSISKGFVDHYGFMEQTKNLEIKLEGNSLKSIMFKAWPYSLLFFVTFLSLCQ
jgi:hypothetical protein